MKRRDFENLRIFGGVLLDSEDALCKACVDYFDTVHKEPFDLIHIPNGGSRNKIEAAKFKRMGVRAGVPDYLVMKNFQPFGWLEFKFGRNVLSDKQKVFRDRCLARGIPWAEIRDVDKFIETLKEWGVLTDNLYELGKRIAIQHEAIFPDATEDEQLKKVDEEVGEYRKGHTIDEMADCFIAISALKYRFNNDIGDLLYDAMFGRCQCQELLIKAVKEKMLINKNRKWTFVNGVHHHVEGE